jgi:uncharacterized Zn-binding protein involved in type VI secretion
MPAVARLGDISDHNGVLITASNDVFANGIGVARTGDLHQCPIPGHGITPMTSDAVAHADGRSIVRLGIDKAGCGAKIASASPNVNAA